MELIKNSQNQRLKPLTEEQLARLNRHDLLIVLRHEAKLRQFLESQIHELQEKIFESDGKFFRIFAKIFSKKSKDPQKIRSGKTNRGERKNSPIKRLPSERYPDADIIEKHITCEELPK